MEKGEVTMNFLGQTGHLGFSAWLGLSAKGTNLGTVRVLGTGPGPPGGAGKTSTILGPSSSSESTL